ncbi:MAG: hypothetical protein HS111_32900 [Kofleriaceae bacterium]|nr:hypothetical protein [Kofleriaceae bacterium]
MPSVRRVAVVVAVVVASVLGGGPGAGPRGERGHACGGGDESPAVIFDLGGALTGDTFFDLPFPSDLRLDADGTPTYAGFPNKGDNRLVASARARSPTPAAVSRWWPAPTSGSPRRCRRGP